MRIIIRFLTILISSLIISLLFQSLGYGQNVLLPDKKYGRKSKVLGNTAVIRVKKEFAAKFESEKQFGIHYKDIIIGNSILKPSESMTLNKSLRKNAGIQSNINTGKIIQAEEPLLRTYRIHYSGDEPPEVFCSNLLNNSPEIEIAEPYYLPELQEYIPNDLYAGQQKMLATCNLFNAWDIAKGDSNLIIGISDNGVFQHHNDLINSIKPNYADPRNGVDDDENGYTDDYLGIDLTGENDPADDTFNSNDHGTNVAGIAAATVDNGLGIAGTGFNCRFFPIKMGVGKDLTFSYESIIYAAIRGFKVLNCSWGLEKRPSEVDQSIINFAVANDVAIVASGGNEDGSLNYNYPSAYDNVLAVGEVDQNDIFSGSNFGDRLDILAPGGGNWYTTNGGNYSNSGSGTSYSAPVVSGILGLIRAKYPELNALQSIELARQSVDDVSGLPGNETWKDIIPGRINAYKALTTPPFSIPSIRPLKRTFTNSTGIESERFATGDTVYMSIDVLNYLGAANNLRFVLSSFWDDDKSINVIDSVVNLGHIDMGGTAKIETYSFLIAKENREKMLFRCDIYGENNYHDFFLLEFTPSPIVTTFSNSAIAFSASDKGTIGFGGVWTKTQGIGFEYKDKGNQIWKSCFIASDFTGRIVNSLFWDRENFGNNDFEFIKQLVPPNRNIGIFDDSKSGQSNNLGIEIKQEFIVPQGYYTFAKLNLDIKNTSSEPIVDFTSGYYFDWDIYNSDSNVVRLVTEAVPEYLQGFSASAEMINYTGGSYPVFGCGVYSLENNTEVQTAGMSSSLHSIYVTDNLQMALNSGTEFQDLGILDGTIFVGMKFKGNFLPNETRKYTIVFGGADNESDFIEKLKIALDTTYSPVEEKDNNQFNIKISPQPAAESAYCTIEAKGNSEIQLIISDIIGRVLLNVSEYVVSGTNIIPLDLSKIGSGRYVLEVRMGNEIKVIPLVIIKGGSKY